jgi:hypothetical protein
MKDRKGISSVKAVEKKAFNMAAMSAGNVTIKELAALAILYDRELVISFKEKSNEVKI